MVVGASGQIGQIALLTVVEAHKRKLALVPTLPLQMAEKTAVENRRRHKIAIRRNVVSPFLW